MKNGGKLIRTRRRHAGANCARRLKPAGPDRSQTWNLTLYIAGMSPNAAMALAKLRTICRQHLAGQYRITVVDLREHPRLARGHQIFAVPTLVRRLPQPMRKFIGDLSDTERVLVGLDLMQSRARN